MITVKNYMRALEPILSRVRSDVSAVKAQKGISSTSQPINEKALKLHLSGLIARGAYLMKPGTDTTRIAILDLDSHDGKTTWATMIKVARRLRRALKENGLRPIPFRSSGGKGIHLYLIWNKPQDARSVRAYLKEILEELGLKSGTGGIAKEEVEIFPKQDLVETGKLGNMVFLPLFNKSLPLESKTLEVLTHEDINNIKWKVSKPISAMQEKVSQKSLNDVVKSDQLSSLLQMIDPDIDYDLWLKAGLAIHHETRGSNEGFEIWDAWSAKGYKYKAGEMRQKWKSFKGSTGEPVTIATLKKLAREAYALSKDDEFDNLRDMRASRFRVHSLEDIIRRPAPKWLIKDLLPETGLVMVFGNTGSGKTFFVLDLLLSIARGKSWCGRDTIQGPVVYVAAEGSSGISKRIRVYTQHHGLNEEALPFGVIDAAPNLVADTDHTSLIKAIRDYGGAKVVVIDTMAQTSPGANENAAEDMGLYLSKCKEIQKELNALVIIVHHTGKDSARGARGWSGLKAAMDTEIEITNTNAGTKAKVTKQKDGEMGDVFRFDLVPIISKGPDGQTETSCIVRYLDGFDEIEKKPSGKLQKALIKIMNGYEANEKVSKAKLIQEAMKTLSTQKEAKSLKQERRDSFVRALETLITKGLLFSHEEFIFRFPPHLKKAEILGLY